MTQNNEASLIPRKILFGNPDRINVRLSPDGKHISFIAPVDGVLNVWVGPASAPDQAQPITKDSKRGIRHHFWPYTNNYVLYVQDTDGDENWHLYRVDINTKEVKDLTPFKNVHAQVLELSERHPDDILIGLNNRKPEFHDIHQLNVRTGEMTLIEENNEFAGYLADEDLKVRMATRMTPDGGSQILQKTDAGG